MMICPFCLEQAIVHSVRGKCRIDCGCEIFDREFTREEVKDRLKLGQGLSQLTKQPNEGVVMGC